MTTQPTLPPKKPSVSGIAIGVILVLLAVLVYAPLVIDRSVHSRYSLGGYAPGYTLANNHGRPTMIDLEAGKAEGIWWPKDNALTGGCTVLDPSGSEVPLIPTHRKVYDEELRYTFKPLVTGTYSISCGSESDELTGFNVLTPRLYGPETVGPIVGLMALAGLALIIITIVRRSNWKDKYDAGGRLAYPQINYPPR